MSNSGKDDSKKVAGGGGAKGNVFGFGGPSFAPPSGTTGLKTQGKSGAFVVNPGWKTKDNSSGGSVIKSCSENSSSSTGNSTSESSVKERVRNIWANKFSSNHNNPVSDESTTCDKKSSEEISSRFNELSDQGHQEKCPVCEKLVHVDRINGHVNKCLNDQRESPTPLMRDNNNPFIDEDSNPEVVEIIGQNINQSAKYPCPVCQRQVYADEMNIHLDNCVT